MASAYERQRDRNVEENHKMLQSLGLAKGASEILGIEKSKKRKRDSDKEAEPIGANWYNFGNVQPNGEELVHTELAEKLAKGITVFSKEEVDGFRFHNLTTRHYICVGDSFFGCVRSSRRNHGISVNINYNDKLPDDDDDKPKKRERRNRVTKEQPAMTLRRRHQDLDYFEDYDDFRDLETPGPKHGSNVAQNAASNSVAFTQRVTKPSSNKEYITVNSKKVQCEHCKRWVLINKNGQLREHGTCRQQHFLAQRLPA